MSEIHVNNDSLFGANDISTKESRATKRENVRSEIARWYVYGFLLIIGAALLIGILKEFTVDEYKDMLVAISGVLSGPLGFIIGFYFKDSSD